MIVYVDNVSSAAEQTLHRISFAMLFGDVI